MNQKITKELGYTVPFDFLDKLEDIILVSNKKGFDKYKLEKDFYLTLILHFVSKNIPDIAFKGGTCLNKIYYPYFRMSEDLDFSLSLEDEVVNSNAKRGKFARDMRNKMKQLAGLLAMELNDDQYHHKKAQGNPQLKKLQYTYLKYVFTYPSVFDKTKQTIKIEVTYTTKRHLQIENKEIQSIFVDPTLEDPIFPSITINCFALEEMLAEKVRAGLTRKKPAIRDLFDVRYVKNQGFIFDSIKDLIHAKIQEVGALYTLEDHYDELKKQVESDLVPVLGSSFGDFDFDQIYHFILTFKKPNA